MAESVMTSIGSLPVLAPLCPLPANVHICTTLRAGGSSEAPYDSLNLGRHVGDNAQAVRANRATLVRSLQLPSDPVWLNQTHGTSVCVNGAPEPGASHDAAWCAQAGRVLAVLTADCLPVVLVAGDGSEIAVAHAGWRGLADGVLQNTVGRFSVSPDRIRAWLGPAIGPEKFEVGREVRDLFCQRLQNSSAVSAAFVTANPLKDGTEKWLADLYQLARIALQEVGVVSVYGGGLCTYSDAGHYYSYRRDGARSGRMATLAWID